jgi:hypothetical protein
MKRISSLLLLLAGFMAMPGPLRGQGVAVGALVGTTGVGGSVSVGLTPRVNVRGTFGFVPWEPEMTVDDVDFVAELPSFGRLTADFYAAGIFYLSGGALILTKGGKSDVTGTSDATFELEGTEYAAADVGSLVGTFALRQVMPYAGIGFGNPVGRRLSFGLDLGVGFGSVPTVDLSATGPIADDPAFMADLQANLAEYEDDIPQILRFYPVVSLSISVGLGG